VGTVDGPPAAASHTAGSFPTLLIERWRLVCAVNDRGKPDEDSIPTLKAWHHVAKMLFPEEPVRCLTKRDDWLIDHYYLPQHFPYGHFDDDCRVSAPKELIAEVDRAYFRRSLQNAVDEWFKRRGFDPDGPTILKQLFEAAVQADFGQPPPEPVKPIEKGVAKAKPRKPTKPGETYSTQLVSLMQEIGLAKSGWRLSEVRKKIKKPFKKKYPNSTPPEDVTINRAYKKYKNAKDTSTE
jgi:hypothetical protein